ncbi:phage portal protein [Saccharopolyspora pogona]|uniref:phage portal protein n=1 Tax=Saccharopolyspora pogona TaxID=333966 RepID=UPI001686ADF3|nr:phage portal protein [Saccharopolyspora pogona]
MTTIDQHVQDLSNGLNGELARLRENESYYDAEHRLKAIGVSVPPEMRALLAQVGWPRTYLSSIEERASLGGFRMAGSSEADERLWSWWQANFLDVKSGPAHTDALMHGRAYATISSPDEDDPFSDPESPVIQVESPLHMYAEIDQRTERVRRAFRPYVDPAKPGEDRGTLYLPDRNVYLVDGPGGWKVEGEDVHDLGVPLVVQLTNRYKTTELYGRSEITPELRSVTDAAARIMMDMQAAAELMAVPQRLLFGVAQEALAANPDDPASVIEAYFARIVAIEDSDAHAMQFAAAELMNFVNVLQELAKQAATYTGLPPQYLSFSSENPASAEAIRSSESRLVKKTERFCKLMGGGWEQVMRVAMLLMDGSISSEARRMEAIWEDPATPTYAAKADAVSKLVAGGIIPVERARIDLGYSEVEREQMRKWDQENPTSQLSAILGTGMPKIPSAMVDSSEKDQAA